MRRFSSIMLALIPAVVVLAPGAVLAQDNAPNPRQACRASALALCHHEAMSGDRAGVRACMIRNFDKAAPECQAAMKAMAAKLHPEGSSDAPPPKP
jgi:hypothetical protein